MSEIAKKLEELRQSQQKAAEANMMCKIDDDIAQIQQKNVEMATYCMEHHQYIVLSTEGRWIVLKLVDHDNIVLIWKETGNFEVYYMVGAWNTSKTAEVVMNVLNMYREM